MKRAIAMTLALLMLAGCFPALADQYYWDHASTNWGWYAVWAAITPAERAAVQQTLRDAGRFTVAQEVYVLDHTGQRLLTVVERDDASQVTLLKKTADGSWQVEAWNDTIPIQRFNHNSACWRLDEPEDNLILRDQYGNYLLDSDQVYEGHFSLELHAVSFPDHSKPGSSLRIDLYPDAEGWFIQSLHLIHNRQEEADDCILSYDSLCQRDGGDWKYDYFEIVDYGQGLERTRDPLYTAVLDGAETMARMRLDDFDFPALIAYLEGLLPDDLPDAHTVPGAVSGREEEDGKQAAAMPETSGVTVYYNAEGGKYYHAAATCSAVAEQWWPLAGIPIEQLNTPNFSRLLPCPRCDPPERPAVPETTETPVTPEASEPPEFVYYNPNGGRYYHAVDDCPSVSPQYQPLAPIPFAQISDPEYARLVPCPRCNPANRSWPDD